MLASHLARCVRRSFMRLLGLALLGLAACGSPTLQVPSTLSVVNLTPTDGAVDVPPESAQSACFSAPVLQADATADHFWVQDASGNRAQGLAVALGQDAHCVSVSHAALGASSGYILHVKAGVRAADGSASLPLDVESRFTTGSAP